MSRGIPEGSSGTWGLLGGGPRPPSSGSAEQKGRYHLGGDEEVRTERCGGDGRGGADRGASWSVKRYGVRP